MQSVDVVIQGAGIAGLALMSMLEKSAMSVVCVDHRPSPDTSGAGILLQRNALLALSHLGIDVDQTESAFTISHINLGSPSHPSALRVPTVGQARAMPRAHLLQTLLANVQQTQVLWGTSIDQYHERPDRSIELTFQDQRQLSCRWLIGADGLHSRIRVGLQGKPTIFRSTEQYCWRMLLMDVDYPQEAYEVHAGAYRFGMIPMGPGQAYLYVVAAGLQHDLAKTMAWHDIKKMFQQGGLLFSRWSNSISASTPMLFHPLVDAPVFMPTKAGVLLLGDAAHPMTPNLGQGAAMALEDAVVLGYLMRVGCRQLASEFHRLRFTRVNRLRQASFNAGIVAHWRHPWLQATRTWGLRMVPKRFATYSQQWFEERFRQQLAALSTGGTYQSIDDHSLTS